MIRVYLGNTNITEMVSRVEISGNWEEVARSCDVSYINAPYDTNISQLPTPKIGDHVQVEDSSDGSLFSGTVSGAEKISSYGAVTANCVDASNALTRNKCRYSFKGMTPETISAAVLADFGVSPGALVSTGITIPSYVVDGKTVYDTIMGAYRKASEQNGKTYQMRASGSAISVVEAKDEASGVILSDETVITSSSYQEKSDGIVNKVILYDKNGNRAGEVRDSESIGKYGLAQETYTMEDGKDNTAAAKEMLTKPEQSLSISAIGDNRVTAGKMVTVHDAATGLFGEYWVKTDRHTYENGIHTMELELSFERMKQKESES